MACVTCKKLKQKREVGYFRESALDFPPLNSADVMVYDGTESRALTHEDWSHDRHKLLLFYPETFTPVCESEMGAIEQWLQFFDEQNCDVYSVTADNINLVESFYKESFQGANYLALSSLTLPTRLGIMNNGRVKRASVFITTAGEVLVQEHFMLVGRSLKELHRTIYAYNTGSYCGEGWQDPSDGFLTHDNH